MADIEAAEKEKMREKCEKIVAHGINCFVNRQVGARLCCLCWFAGLVLLVVLLGLGLLGLLVLLVPLVLLGLLGLLLAWQQQQHVMFRARLARGADAPALPLLLH